MWRADALNVVACAPNVVADASDVARGRSHFLSFARFARFARLCSLARFACGVDCLVREFSLEGDNALIKEGTGYFFFHDAQSRTFYDGCDAFIFKLKNKFKRI